MKSNSKKWFNSLQSLFCVGWICCRSDFRPHKEASQIIWEAFLLGRMTESMT
jgi:hypothetical protein